MGVSSPSNSDILRTSSYFQIARPSRLASLLKQKLKDFLSPVAYNQFTITDGAVYEGSGKDI